MAQYTTTTLLDDIRTGGMFPAASTALFTDADLLRLADREMQTGIVPLILGVREDYFSTYTDVAITSGAGTQDIRIPYRAIGGKLQNVALMGNGNDWRYIPRLDVTCLENSNGGFYVSGNVLTLWNPIGNWNASSARLSYFLRPNKLVLTTAVGVVATVTPATKVVTVTSAPAGWPTASAPYDFVRAKPGYESLGIDQYATRSSTTLTFATALPADLAVGDYVCLPEESPVPQIPSEFHPVLAQRVICKALEAINDASGLGPAQAKLIEMQHAAMAMICPRVDGEQKHFKNLSSPFRRRRRWLLY